MKKSRFSDEQIVGFLRQAEAGMAVKELCPQRAAVVRPQTTDRYGRTVARVECDGMDASAEQVRAGMAWAFDRYVTDRGLYAVQDQARGERRGLWADPEAVPPWGWRRSGKLAHSLGKSA